MERVGLKVLGLSRSLAQGGAYALVLADERERMHLSVVIGRAEAQAIAIRLEGLCPVRPMMPQVLQALATSLGAVLEEVFIHDVENGAFRTELVFRTREKLLRLEARLSDAVALALAYGCPLYATPEVIAMAGIPAQEPSAGGHAAPVQTVEKPSGPWAYYSVEELQQLLAQAVEEEAYERAAELKLALRARARE